MIRSKSTAQHAERKPEKKVRQHQSTLRLFSQVEIPNELVRELLRAAEYGDIPTVQEILSGHHFVDANAPDMFGRTALQIAVANEHAEIVEILLDHSSPENIYLALLLAINHNYENITELILKHPTYRQYHDKWQELACRLPDTSPFSDDISPIILACQKNLFGIVHLLLQDNMRVPVPHHFDCSCEACQEGRTEDQLKHAKRRLNEYRALTSEAYISLTSPDPFQTAFELCHEMELRATWEKHFKREYKALVASLRRYVVKLLDCIRTHDELVTILNWSGGLGAGAMATPTGDTVLKKRQAKIATTPEQLAPQPLARLRMAIYYHQKEFVSHWACQQELMRKWLRGFSQYQGSSSPTKIFTNLLLTLLAYPILMVFHWIAPESKLGRMVTKPMVKFVAYSMSYLFFLGILFIITITPTGFYALPQRLSEIRLPADAYQPMFTIIAQVKGITANSEVDASGASESLLDVVRQFCNETFDLLEEPPPQNLPVVDGVGQLSKSGVWQICRLDKDFTVRPNADNWVCWIVTVWLFGLLCRKIRQLVRGSFSTGGPGSQSFFPSLMRSPFDMIDTAQLAFFAASLAARLYAYSRVTESVVWFLSLRPSLSLYSQFPDYLYWLVSDRVYFSPGDPMTISELLFAVGGVFSFARLLYIFPALEVFGPCYLALMRVVKDIFAFFFVFLVVFGAFMLGTLNVYWYFNPELRQTLQLNDSYQPEIPAEVRFGNIELTFRTVFWSLFGLGESDYMSVNNFGNGSMIWVERIGYIMYGAYNVVVVCVLLNMLIAMMAKSYEVIKQNSEMEWKFARTILFLEYIPMNTPTIPTPFNLLPNPRYLWEMVCNLVDAVRPLKGRRSKQHGQNGLFCTEGGIGRRTHSSESLFNTGTMTTEVNRSTTRTRSNPAPVQIRIVESHCDDDEPASPSHSDEGEEGFIVESVPVPVKTRLTSSLSISTLNSDPGKTDNPMVVPTTSQPQPAARASLRVENGTMTSTSQFEDEDDYLCSCCNYCYLTKCVTASIPDSSPRVRTRGDRSNTQDSTILGTPLSGGKPISARRLAPNLHLAVPGNRYNPNTEGISTRRARINPHLMKFRSVVFNILRRYILGLSTQSNDTSVDLEEIKQDISSFRFEVLNLLAADSGAMPPGQSGGGGSGPPSNHHHQLPVATAGNNGAAMNGSTLNRNHRRLSRTSLHQSNSPASIKSLSGVVNAAVANSGLASSELFATNQQHTNLTRTNSVGNNLLIVSPSQHLMTPNSEVGGSDNGSPSQESSPSVSMIKTPRSVRSFAPYRRRSLLPSSIVGSLIPVVTTDSPNTSQETESDESPPHDELSRQTSGEGTPPQYARNRPMQHRSPGHWSHPVAVRSISIEPAAIGMQPAASLEEVDEEAMDEDKL